MQTLLTIIDISHEKKNAAKLTYFRVHFFGLSVLH